MESSGLLVTAVAIGAPTAALVAVGRSVVGGRRVPMAAVAVLAAVVPAAGMLVGIWVTFASSKAAGDVIVGVSGAGLLLATLTLLLGIVMPERRRLAKALCGLVVATAVPVGTLFVIAHTADGRHADWVENFPVAGTARSATVEEKAYLFAIEYHVATRTFEDSGLGCGDLTATLAAHAGVAVTQVRAANDLRVPGGSCAVETQTAWRGSQAALTPDGRLVVAAWSPTADLFVF
jgi:hypothetical protein